MTLWKSWPEGVVEILVKSSLAQVLVRLVRTSPGDHGEVLAKRPLHDLAQVLMMGRSW